MTSLCAATEYKELLYVILRRQKLLGFISKYIIAMLLAYAAQQAGPTLRMVAYSRQYVINIKI